MLGVRLATVYRLRELGKLPGEIEVQAIGGRKRWWRRRPCAHTPSGLGERLRSGRAVIRVRRAPAAQVV